jgi:YVTN family beta-propeller protein
MPIDRRRACLPIVLVGALLIATACSGGAADPGTLIVLTHGPSGEVRFMQMGSGAITGRVQVGGEPSHVVRDAARGRVYVTDRAGDSVIAVDVLSREVVQRVRVGREPHAAVLSPDGLRLYVAATGENALAIVDAESLRMLGRVPVGARPTGVAVSSDGSRVYVVNDGDDTIQMVDPTGLRRQRPFAVSVGVQGGLTLSNDGATLLSGAAGRPAIAAITLSSREVKEVPLGAAVERGGTPSSLLATPDGRFWVAALAGSDDVVALPLDGGEPRSIPVGLQPTGLVVAPGGRVLVASRDGENLVELDLDRGKATRRIRVGQGHTDVTVFSRSLLEALQSR